MYTSVSIAPAQPVGVQTELLYAVAAKKAEKGGLVCFSFVYEDERLCRAAVAQARRTLKDAKKRGTVGLYVFSESFGIESTEMEYLKNVYPTIEEREELIAPMYPYVLVHVME